MSCKILSDSKAQGLQWRQLRGTQSEQRWTTPTQSVAPRQEAGELQKLHARIVELEQAMESEIRQARDRGFQEGLKAGQESASAQVQPVMDKLLRSCADVANARTRMRREAESDIVSLTVAIARRVLRRELSVDPDAIHGIIKAGLEKVQQKEICQIRVHPEHLLHARQFFEKSGLAAGLEITADPTLQLGGVVIETKRGNLDASVETQLKEIERGFTDRLGN
jgi:flagellar assembly protein FliH